MKVLFTLLVFMSSLTLSAQRIYDFEFKKGDKVFLANAQFDQGKFVIPTALEKELDTLAEFLNLYYQMRIEVQGYSDVVGEENKNVTLSKKRVENVKSYLVSKGIEAERIEIKAFGGKKPIVKKGSPLNRRIEIYILENPHSTSRKKPAATKSQVEKDSIKESITKTAHVSSQRRLALLIGNAEYQFSPQLKNPVHDVQLMSKTLTDLNFQTKTYSNLGQEEMMAAIREFVNELHGADVALFYYAGHGLQVDGKNYLLPVDAKLSNGEKDLYFEAINADFIIRAFDYTNKESLNVMILDACRNNPYKSAMRGGSGGLAEMKPSSGTIVAFATSPGSVAFDGDGQNGLYTGELVQQLVVPQRIEDVFMNTRIQVEEKSKGEQSPWELARLRGKFYLK